jgi:transposase
MRSGFNGLAAKVQTTLQDDPFSGHVFVFRGRRGDIIKLLWWTGDDLTPSEYPNVKLVTVLMES